MGDGDGGKIVSYVTPVTFLITSLANLYILKTVSYSYLAYFTLVLSV